MSHPLAEFLDGLSAEGGIARVHTPVDPRLEIAQLTRQVTQSAGPALLFDQINGSSLAAVTNLLGTEKRLCLALGIDSLSQLSDLLERGLPVASRNWFERLRGSGEQGTLDKLRPRPTKTGDCQQVVRLGRDIDLIKLPAIQCWPQETGPQLTATRLITADPAGKRRGVELCRLQVLDGTRLALVDDGQDVFPRNWAEFTQSSERMPVAVALGGPPADTLAAWLNLPGDVDGHLLAGLLRGRPVELVKCRTGPLDVPADADLVLEGYLDPADAPVAIGTSSLATGYYALPGPAPVLNVTAITSRTNPIIPAIVSGPGGELAVLHKAKERLFLPLVKAAIPELIDYSLPAWGGFERFAVLAIRKTYPRQASKVTAAFWGLAPLQSTKFVAIVDEEVNVHDHAQVLAALGANVDPSRDVFVHPAPAHRSDHAAPTPLVGQALGIDATSKLPAEHSHPWPARLAMSQEVLDLVARRWTEYGVEEGSG